MKLFSWKLNFISQSLSRHVWEVIDAFFVQFHRFPIVLDGAKYRHGWLAGNAYTGVFLLEMVRETILMEVEFY